MPCGAPPRTYLRLTPLMLLSRLQPHRDGVGPLACRHNRVGGNKAAPQMVYFGTETRVADVAAFVIPIELVVGFFFVLIASTMVGVGQLIGRRFAAIPIPCKRTRSTLAAACSDTAVPVLLAVAFPDLVVRPGGAYARVVSLASDAAKLVGDRTCGGCAVSRPHPRALLVGLSCKSSR